MVLLIGILLFCIIPYGAAIAQDATATNNNCQKLHECIQLAHDQTQQCRNLLAQLSEGKTQSQCETQMKEKQKEYLEKLSAKNAQLNSCVTRSGATTAVEEPGRQKAGKKQAQCRNADAIQLKTVKSYTEAKVNAGERAARKQQKQGPKKLKQCLNAVLEIKGQCKNLAKCCPAAKTCYEEFKNSSLNKDIDQLKAELANAKRTCKPGGGRQNGGAGGGGRRRGGKTDALVAGGSVDHAAVRLTYRH